MRRNNEGLYILFFALGGLFVLLGVIATSDGDAHQAANDYAYQYGTAIEHEAPKWTDKAMVWFTLALTAATIIMAFLMRRQTLLLDQQRQLLEEANKTANDALRLTNENLKTYVEAERGRVVLGEVRFTANATRIAYSLKNAGRGTVLIKGIGIRFRRSSDGLLGLDPIGRYVPKWTMLSVPILHGAEYATGEHGAIYIPKYCYWTAADVDESMVGELADGYIVQFSVFYTTMGMRKHYWCNWGWESWGALKLNGEGYEREDEAPQGWITPEMQATEAAITTEIEEYARKKGFPIEDYTIRGDEDDY